MFLDINPHKIKLFILSLEDSLKRKYPEPKKYRKGRKRIGVRWIIIALAIICRYENIAWRNVPHMLSSCDFLIEDGYLKRIPSWQKFYQEWRNIRVDTLESFIIQLGTKITKQTKMDRFDVAVDSSGFAIYGGSVWRYLKWAKSRIKKTSKLFRKIHIAISLPKRAIIAIVRSKSNEHDAIIFSKLWKHLPKRLIPKIRRMHLDKAYWDEKIIGLLDQFGITSVIPPKKDSVDHGNNSTRDKIVRAIKNYPGLYKYNMRAEWRASVEHVFGLIKLKPFRITERKDSTRAKALLLPFLCYNFVLYLEGLKTSSINF